MAPPPLLARTRERPVKDKSHNGMLMGPVWKNPLSTSRPGTKVTPSGESSNQRACCASNPIRSASDVLTMTTGSLTTNSR